ASRKHARVGRCASDVYRLGFSFVPAARRSPRRCQFRNQLKSPPRRPSTFRRRPRVRSHSYPRVRRGSLWTTASVRLSRASFAGLFKSAEATSPGRPSSCRSNVRPWAIASIGAASDKRPKARLEGDVKTFVESLFVVALLAPPLVVGVMLLVIAL